MANLSLPTFSGAGGFTPVNRSPGNDSISSGLPAHDEEKRRSDTVAAVVGYVPSKASPEPVRELAVSSSSEEAGGHHSGSVCDWVGALCGRWVVAERFRGSSNVQNICCFIFILTVKP